MVSDLMVWTSVIRFVWVRWFDGRGAGLMGRVGRIWNEAFDVNGSD